MQHHDMKLSDLSINDKAIILSLDELKSEQRKKLLVMGVLPNTEIKFICTAPMGDPIQILVYGVLLSLRKQVASLIKVERV